MVNKFEAIGILVSISLMAVALFFLNIEDTGVFSDDKEQPASEAAIISADNQGDVSSILPGAFNDDGTVNKLVVDDIVLGVGEPVEKGDTISVHYIGTLQNGQQFDNSYLSGKPFSFTVGEGEVIKGWDQGVVGMKAGGQRILVIPSEFAYGKNGYGPIPGNATLVFAIELLSIE